MTAPFGFTCVRPRVDPTFIVGAILHKTKGRTVVHIEGEQRTFHSRETYGHFGEESEAERHAYRLTVLAAKRRKLEIAKRRELNALEQQTEHLLRAELPASAR